MNFVFQTSEFGASKRSRVEVVQLEANKRAIVFNESSDTQKDSISGVLDLAATQFYRKFFRKTQADSIVWMYRSGQDYRQLQLIWDGERYFFSARAPGSFDGPFNGPFNKAS